MALHFSRDRKWVAYVSYPAFALCRSRVDGSDRLQRTLLPSKAPNIPGLELAGYNAPCRTTDPVLGILPNQTYEQRTCHLDRGDLLILFSDGVTEACRPDRDEEFGEKRLAAFARDHQTQSAAELIEAINREVISFTSGAPAGDDVTLVIARRS
jgi:hypothetical protein